MSIEETVERLKGDVDQLKAQVVVNDACMAALAALYSAIWIEACYDPDNEASERFARQLLPHIHLLNAHLKFRR